MSPGPVSLWYCTRPPQLMDVSCRSGTQLELPSLVHKLRGTAWAAAEGPWHWHSLFQQCDSRGVMPKLPPLQLSSRPQDGSDGPATGDDEWLAAQTQASSDVMSAQPCPALPSLPRSGAKPLSLDATCTEARDCIARRISKETPFPVTFRPSNPDQAQRQGAAKGCYTSETGLCKPPNVTSST